MEENVHGWAIHLGSSQREWDQGQSQKTLRNTRKQHHRVCAETAYMTKVTMATLERDTEPMFNPKPMQVREANAPNVDIVSRGFLPIF